MDNHPSPFYLAQNKTLMLDFDCKIIFRIFEKKQVSIYDLFTFPWQTPNWNLSRQLVKSKATNLQNIQDRYKVNGIKSKTNQKKILQKTILMDKAAILYR